MNLGKCSSAAMLRTCLALCILFWLAGMASGTAEMCQDVPDCAQSFVLSHPDRLGGEGPFEGCFCGRTESSNQHLDSRRGCLGEVLAAFI